MLQTGVCLYAWWLFPFLQTIRKCYFIMFSCRISSTLLWCNWKEGVTQRPHEHWSPHQLNEPSLQLHLGHSSYTHTQIYKRKEERMNKNCKLAKGGHIKHSYLLKSCWGVTNNDAREKMTSFLPVHPSLQVRLAPSIALAQ